jgi:hypothetical protein
LYVKHDDTIYKYNQHGTLDKFSVDIDTSQLLDIGKLALVPGAILSNNMEFAVKHVLDPLVIPGCCKK